MDTQQEQKKEKEEQLKDSLQPQHLQQQEDAVEEEEEDVKSASDEFQDIDFDDDNQASSTSISTATPTASLPSSDTASTLTAAVPAAPATPTLPQDECLREQEEISPKSQARPLTDDAPTNLNTPRTSLHAPPALIAQAQESVTPTAAQADPQAGPQAGATPQPTAASSTVEQPISRLSLDSKENTSSGPASAATSPSAPRRSFWGLLKTATTPEPGQTSSSSAQQEPASSTPASETAPVSPLPRLSLSASALNPDAHMAVASAPASGARDSIASSSGSAGPRSSLAPSFFGLPASPSPTSPGFPTGSTPEPTPSSSRKPSAFSPFASIMSNLRTRTSNVSGLGFGGTSAASSSSNNHDGDDLDGRSRLPRRDLDEDKLAEEVMRFAEARHVLRTEIDVEELRRLGLRLEEAWREKLAEVGILRAKLESAQDTVGDLEDENANLRKQLGLLSEQIAARETDLEDFQKLTIGQIEAQRALWEEEGREERENLQFNLAQSKRETLEQKSINAQLRLVILGTLQGRLDGLTDWLAKQNEGESKKARRRMSTQIGKRRESLKSMIMSMDQTLAEEGTSTPLMRQQTFAAEDGDDEQGGGNNPAGMPSSSAMDEVSSTTSGKAPGGSWSPRQSDGDQTEEHEDDEDDEEGDHLFDIEDVLFNLPTSPSGSGRPATMLFNEPLNLDQLKKMGFFREENNELGGGAVDGERLDGEDAKSGAAAAGGFLSPSSSFEKRGGGATSANSTRPSSSSSPFFAFGSSSSTSAAPPSTTAQDLGISITSPGQSPATLSHQRMLILIEKLQADHALAEAARAENVLLQKRIEEESRRAHELEEELVQTKVRLEQTEAAVSDLFGGQQDENEDEDEGAGVPESLDGGDAGLKGGSRGSAAAGRASGIRGGDATVAAAAGQQGLGLVTGSV
ncbi:hypothetical protein OC845_000674 [Tilletia horrida]|nr:hypothetical protein OC845_000674 [Tilletia horrida]